MLRDFDKINLDWFEMREILKRDFNKKVWVPLHALHKRSVGEFGYNGFVEEFFGATSLIFKKKDFLKAMEPDWPDVNNNEAQSRPSVESGKYTEVGNYVNFESKIKGTFPILEQYFYCNEKREYYLNQDIVLGLQLIKKENENIWLRPEDDFAEVVRITQNNDGDINIIEIKNEYLKDYLSARKSGLAVYTFQSRSGIFETPFNNQWDENQKNIKLDYGRWQGYYGEIHEGGDPIGSKTAVFHLHRTDVDFEEDVPLITGDPNDENLTSKQWEVESKGKKLFRYEGNLWKTEWIEPSKKSPIVKGDKVPSKTYFIIGSDGKSINGDKLKDHDGWLWFKPNLANDLLSKPLPFLTWYSSDTGKIGGARDKAFHFGMNELGYINIFAEDLRFLNEIHKKNWASYNITPDGGVSKELLMSQVNAQPAKTFAPEKALYEIPNLLDNTFSDKFGYKLFKDNIDIQTFFIKIHRFISIDKLGLYKLAKEITKYIIERIDIDNLKRINPKAKKDLGSIKRLESVLNLIGLDGRELTSVLVGVYDLRIADAHIESSNVSDSLELANLKLGKPWPLIGKELINNVAKCLYIIKHSIEST